MNLIKSNGRDSFRSWNSDEMFNELANNNRLIGLSSTESDGGGSSEGLKVSRRIMIVKPPITQSGSPPVSPAGSTPPVSPFAGGGEAYRLFRRRSLSDAYEKPSGIRPGSPRPPYNV